MSISREERIDGEILERARMMAGVLAEDGEDRLAAAVMAQACDAVNRRQLERLCAGAIRGEEVVQ